MCYTLLVCNRLSYVILQNIFVEFLKEKNVCGGAPKVIIGYRGGKKMVVFVSFVPGERY